MRKVKVYRCPECQKAYRSLGGWANHMDTVHPESRPNGFSDARFFYFVLTGRDTGRCIVCHGATDWNETTAKYNRFCNNPKCKEEYKKEFDRRMISKYGKTTRMDEPDFQRKVLEAKHISSKYKFPDGGEIPYVGTYEEDFLRMMDKLMHYTSKDIMGPSPHTYYYMYEGKKHFYIPDFYIPNLNLEIEIKQNTSTHPKILAVDKVKEKNKDDVMKANTKVNYIKIVDKKYEGFINYLLELKEGIPENDLDSSKETKILRAQESVYGNMRNRKQQFTAVLEGLLTSEADDISTLEQALESVGMTTVKEHIQDTTPDPEPVYDPVNIETTKELGPGALLKSNNTMEQMLPCVLDDITGNSGDDIPDVPLKIASTNAQSTPDPDHVGIASDRDEAMRQATNMIEHFDVYNPVTKRWKAQKILELNTKWNLGIDVAKYPKIIRFANMYRQIKNLPEVNLGIKKEEKK